MMKKWKLSDFWKQTLSCTLGTIIGIIFTFGTSAWIENREKKATERTAALMVIHNLDVFCDDLEETTKDLQAVDSINMKVLAAKDRLETVLKIHRNCLLAIFSLSSLALMIKPLKPFSVAISKLGKV